MTIKAPARRRRVEPGAPGDLAGAARLLVCVLVAGLVVVGGCADRHPDGEPPAAPDRARASDPGSPPAASRPSWLQAMIDQTLSAKITNPPTQILSFEYRDQVVYYRPPFCCDIPGLLFNDSGEVMCQPDGGFTGEGDGRCPDFFRARTNCSVVWRDPRAKAHAADPCLAPQRWALPES